MPEQHIMSKGQLQQGETQSTIPKKWEDSPLEKHQTCLSSAKSLNIAKYLITYISFILIVNILILNGRYLESHNP